MVVAEFDSEEDYRRYGRRGAYRAFGDELRQPHPAKRRTVQYRRPPVGENL
jgi:hypothetical protein